MCIMMFAIKGKNLEKQIVYFLHCTRTESRTTNMHIKSMFNLFPILYIFIYPNCHLKEHVF